MTKLGTPIGAAPNWAMVRPGLALVGEPSGLRTGGCSIFSRWALITPFALPCLGPFLPKRPPPGAAPGFFVPPAGAPGAGRALGRAAARRAAAAAARAAAAA